MTTTEPPSPNIGTQLDLIASRLKTLRLSIDTLRDALIETDRTQTKRRRWLGFFLILATVVGIQIHDVHVYKCSPGSRALKVVEAVARREARSVDDIATAVANEQPRPFCESTFPLHTYGTPGRSWPTEWNLVGLVGYGVLFGGLGAFAASRPRDHVAPGLPDPDDDFMEG